MAEKCSQTLGQLCTGFRADNSSFLGGLEVKCGKPATTAAAAERKHLSNDAVALARHTDESGVCERGRAARLQIDIKGCGIDNMRVK